MLKVKDNIDLNVLKKYGFKKHKSDEKGVVVSKWCREICYGDDDSDKYYFQFHPLIEIIPNSKGENFLYFRNSYYNFKYIIADTIYELTKANLLEYVKVYV